MTVLANISRKEEFETQGFLIEPGVFSVENCEKMKRICQNACHQLNDSSSGVSVFNVENLPEGSMEFINNPVMTEVLKEILSDQVEFLSFKPVYKSSEISFGSPWHQDWSYWGGSHKVSLWIALDEATVDNGCLKVIPGSHKKAWEHQVVNFTNGFGNRVFENDLLNETILDVPLKPGDALFFHDWLLHASHKNTSGKDRWSFIPTYRDIKLSHLDTVNQNLWRKTIAL